MKTLFRFKPLLLLVALGPARLLAQGVSFDLQVDLLQTATAGVALPLTGLVLLAADTGNNGFGPVTVTSIGSGTGNVFSSGLTLNGAAGDDLILWRSDLSGGFNLAGLLLAAPSLTRGTYGDVTWGTGAPLALLWFPNLTIDSTNTVAGTPYGLVSGGSALGQPWVTPGDVSAYQLYFITTNDTNTTGLDGTSLPSLLVASHTVSAIPEPATTAALVGLGVLGFAMHRRRRRTV